MKKRSFNEGWQFNGKPVILPHDAMLLAPRRADAESGSGGAYFEGGVYEYEKTFPAPAEWEGKELFLQFEGVYRNAKVYLNGQELGGAAYGYIPFFVKLTGLKYGEENTLRVTADNSKQPNSRWYSGGGIYRPVWLWECEKGGLRPQCVQITTLSYDPARIEVKVAAGAGPKVEILDGGTVVASAVGNSAELEIPNAKLWSSESPYLYTCRVSLGTDVTEEKFGVQKIEWSPGGLFVNGKETLLRGGCVHHDNGILGAASFPESERRKAEKLKEAGFNAIRSSHNPISPAMLEACDEVGLYIMDEMWDMWYSRKNREDYALDFPNNYKSDIRSLVARDYNHPSVLMYSIGNEVSEPATEKGVALAKEMISLFHELDPSRPVTAGINLMILYSSAKGKGLYKEEGGKDNKSEQKMNGMNSTMYNLIASVVGTGMNKGANSKKADAATSPILDALDIAGYNYASGRYPLESKAHPGRVVVGSETFPQDIAKNWAMVKEYPYLIGDFMWTAWDYLGEAGIGAWAYSEDGKAFDKPYPWLLADVGALDILGNPTGEAFWAQAVWGLLKEPKMAVRPVNHPEKSPIKATWRGTNAIPSWSWRGCEGNKAVVEVYFDCARVDLLLNGMPVGGSKVKDCRAVIKTKYAPGRLEAVCYNARGNEIGRCALETAASADIQLEPERETAKPGEAVYIPVELGDGSHVESNTDRALTVSVENGVLLGFGSANPRTEESFLSGTYTAYYGRALAVVKAGETGSLAVSVTDGQDAASAVIEIR